MTNADTIAAVLTWQANPRLDSLMCSADSGHGKLIPKETPAGVIVICIHCDAEQGAIPDTVLEAWRAHASAADPRALDYEMKAAFARLRARKLVRRDPQKHRPAKVVELTGKAWTEEITRAVASSGLPWRVSSCWIAQRGCLYEADLTNTRTGRGCRVSLEAERFVSPAERRAEVTRQLEAHRER